MIYLLFLLYLLCNKKQKNNHCTEMCSGCFWRSQKMAGKAHSVSGGRMLVFEPGVEVVLRPLEAVFRVVVVILVSDVGQTFLVVDGSICAEDFVTFRIRFRTFVQMIKNTEQTDNIPYVIRVRECLVKELEHIVEPRLYDPHRMDYAGHRIAKVDDANIVL